MAAITCENCSSDDTVKKGFTSSGKQKYYCKDCLSYGSISVQAISTRQRKDKFEQELRRMDKSANEVIRNWSFGALAANLLPPPLDSIAVAGAFARLGQRIAQVYGVPVTFKVLKHLGKSMAAGITGVTTAAYLGMSLLKYIPGVNIWVALLIQPPIVAAIAYSVGNSFKQYFRIHITEGRDLTSEQIREMAEAFLREKLQ